MDWLRETQWLLWIGFALVAGLLETLSLDFVFSMVVGGALAAAFTAWLGYSFTVQVIVFAVVSGVLLVAVRPPLRRFAERRSPFIATNADALVGREVEVLAPVTARGGQVKLAGEVWSARSAADGGIALEPGSSAWVVRIDGATAVVAPQPHVPGEEPA
jgi:membrane protein implicated in regulation of membrane protease activity